MQQQFLMETGQTMVKRCVYTHLLRHCSSACAVLQMNRKCLKAVQRKCTIMISRAHRTTSYDASQSCSGSPSTHWPGNLQKINLVASDTATASKTLETVPLPNKPKVGGFSFKTIACSALQNWVRNIGKWLQKCGMNVESHRIMNLGLGGFGQRWKLASSPLSNPHSGYPKLLDMAFLLSSFTE